MMLVGNGWAFIHVPKVGGTTVRAVLTGIEVAEVLPMYPNHTVDHRFHWVAAERPPGRVFCFVRHPLAWLKSYWSMRMLEPPNNGKVLDRLLSPNFDIFARRVCKHRAGYVGRMFEAYIDHASEVHRLEDGVDPVLSSILRRTTITERLNRGNPPKASPKTVSMVAHSERRFMARYGYR